MKGCGNDSSTAAIYARFSCSKQREASIDDQLRVCEEWCAREGYRVVARYCDYAVSGTTDHRPEFLRMVDNAGESDIVLVYMMDRFSRDPYDAPVYKKRLAAKGVRVVSATEAMPDGPESVLLEKIYEGMAAMESAHISMRTARGMRGNALKCMHNGVRLFGYAFAPDGTYEVDPEEAKVVREAFARRVSGESCHSIAASLAARGVKTTFGNPASDTFVRHMLKNEKYAGVYAFDDVRVEGGMPAIVGREEFDAAQGVRAKKRRADEQWDDFPLSGKVLCSGCGRSMPGVSGRGRNGTKYRYHKCMSGCVKPVRADWLEGELASSLRGMLEDRETALRIAKAVESCIDLTRDEEELKRAVRRREKAEKGLANMLDAVAAGFDPEAADGKARELKAEIAAAEAEIARIEARPRFDAEDFADFLQFGATLDDAALLDAFVFQASVSEDAVVAALNYDEDPASGGEKKRPATIDIARVRRKCIWLPVCENVRTAYSDGFVLISFDRAA